MSEKEDTRLTRRDFLKRTLVGAAVGLGATSGLSASWRSGLFAGPTKKEAMNYRKLGRTGLRVSELGLGTIKIDNPAVVRRALDLGVNFVDTAACYQGGNSEEKLERALRSGREKVIVATKWHTRGSTPAAKLLESLDGSLKRMGTDYVDLIQIHGAAQAEQVESDELWDAFVRAKSAGKVRFHGLSTHANQEEVVRSAIATNRYDAVLVSYNAMIGERIGPVLADAAKAGLGVIAMKALQPVHYGKAEGAFEGLPGHPYQRAIQWVLRNEHVSTVIVDMPTFGEVDEDMGAIGMRTAAGDFDAFERAVATGAIGACHMCGACIGQCPHHVHVADIMRYHLYYDGYRDRRRARALYRALPAKASAAACLDCTECRVVCPRGVPVQSRLVHMHEVLA